LKRGDLVLAVASGDYGKPRPCVVVQATELMDFSDSVLLCPVTTHLTGAKLRVPLEPGPQTALRERSEVIADKPMAVKRERIRQVIGSVPESRMSEINAALIVILGLRGKTHA